MSASIPSQKNIIETIRSSVDMISDITNIITDIMSIVNKISIESVNTLNTHLNAIYGKGGVIDKIEEIQESLHKSRLNRFNPFRSKFIKMHLREIVSIVDMIKKISRRISNRKLKRIKNFEELVNYVNSIITLLDNIKINIALPIKIAILTESLKSFSEGVIETLKETTFDILKSGPGKLLDIITTITLMHSVIVPSIYSIIEKINSFTVSQYLFVLIKLNLFHNILERLSQTVSSIQKLNKSIKDIRKYLKMNLIVVFFTKCFNILITTIDSLKKINLIPTEIVKLHILNSWILPMIFSIFEQVMNYFNPFQAVKVLIPINNKTTVIKRKAAWKPMQYINTIIGLSMMAIIFKKFEFILDSIKIFKIIIGSALNAWDKLQECISKLLDIFTYIMDYFNPFKEVDIEIPFINIKKKIIKRKAAWKPMQYINTIIGMINMTIVFKLINKIMKSATVAALLSIPFSICAIPFKFSIEMLFDIITIIIEKVNALERVAIKKLLMLSLFIVAISFIGIELFALALVAKIVIANIGWIFLLLGTIIAILVAMIPICLIGTLFSIIGPLAITGMFILTAVISAVVLIAYELKLLQYVELDRYLVINNVDTVLAVSRYIINMLFGGDKEDSFDQVSESESWLDLIISVVKGSTDLIKIIAASAIITFTLISVTLILFTVVVLKLMTKIAGSLDKPAILSAVNTVTSISNFIINAVFGNSEYDVETNTVNKTEKYNNTNFFKRVFGGIGDLITALASSVMLISTALSIGALSLTVKMLDNIQNSNLNDELIRKNVVKIINACKLVIDTVNAPSDTKEKNKSDGIIGKALNALLPSNLKYALDAIITMPFLAMTWLSISLINGLLNTLEKIEKMPNFTNIETNVKTIMTTCKNIISTVNSNSESFDLDNIEKHDKLLKGIKKLIKKILSISKIKVASAETISTNITSIKTAIDSFVTILLPTLESLPDIKRSNRIVVTLQDINRITENLNGLSNLNVNAAISGIDSIVNIVDTLIEKTDKNKQISRKRKYKDSLENIDRYFKVLKKMTTVFSVNNSDFSSININDHEKFINTNIRFLDKIHEVDTEKLKKTTKLYSQLRKTVMTTCENIISTVNSNSESFDLDNIEKHNNLLNGAEQLITKILSIAKIKVASAETISTNITSIKTAVDSFITILLPTLESLPDIKRLNSIVIILQNINKNINRITENLNGLSNLNVNAAISGIDSVVNIVDTLIEKTNKNEQLSRKRKYKDSLENIDRYFKVLTKMTNVFSTNNSDFGSININDHEKFINTNIRFLDKINEVDTEKLKKTTNLYSQLRKFSESINGNFEALAEALTDKLVPVLEDLKEVMIVIPEKIDSSSSRISKSVNLLQSPSNKINVEEQIKLENPNLSSQDVERIVKNRMNERAAADANGVSAKLDELIALLKGFGGNQVVVRTI